MRIKVHRILRVLTTHLPTVLHCTTPPIKVRKMNFPLKFEHISITIFKKIYFGFYFILKIGKKKCDSLTNHLDVDSCKVSYDIEINLIEEEGGKEKMNEVNEFK